MTYRDLRDQLLSGELTDEQLDMDVTIYDAEKDEFYGCYASELSINKSDDALDENHPYLSIKKSVEAG